MRTRTTLLTASALVMAASAAAAEVTLSGSAEMGVAGSKDDSARFHTDVNVKFAMSGATDGGLTFGTAIELAESGDGSNAVDNDDEHGGISIYLKGPFGNLELGDTDGGFDWAMNEVAIGGAIRDDHEHGAYSGNGGLDGKHDGQILRYDNAIGPIAFAASVELDDDLGGTDGSNTGDPIIGLGAKYSMGMPGNGTTVGVGLGYQRGSTMNDEMAETKHSIMGLSADVSMTGGLEVRVNHSRQNDDKGGGMETKTTHTGLGLGYTAGLITVGVNVGSMTKDMGADGDEKTKGGGVSAVYDLGSGAKLQLGIGASETEEGATTTDKNKWSLGLAFSF